MSALSSNAILDKINSGEVYLSPILSKAQVGAASIDLRVGNVAMMVKASSLSHVDPIAYRTTSRSNEEYKRQRFSRHDFEFHEQILLHPGTLTLVPTLEWISLPANLKGVVTARSSWAREGLNIATANFINPGYNGIITLELANFGEIPIGLYAGMRVAQIALYVVEGQAEESSIPSQFDMSFEPRGGEISKDDEPFLPPA